LSKIPDKVITLAFSFSPWISMSTGSYGLFIWSILKGNLLTCGGFEP
jgi:hypothetical protein